MGVITVPLVAGYGRVWPSGMGCAVKERLSASDLLQMVSRTGSASVAQQTGDLAGMVGCPIELFCHQTVWPPESGRSCLTTPSVLDVQTVGGTAHCRHTLQAGVHVQVEQHGTSFRADIRSSVAPDSERISIVNK